MVQIIKELWNQINVIKMQLNSDAASRYVAIRNMIHLNFPAI